MIGRAVAANEAHPVFGERLYGDAVVLVNKKRLSRVVDHLQTKLPTPCTILGLAGEGAVVGSRAVCAEFPSLNAGVGAHGVPCALQGVRIHAVVRQFPSTYKVFFLRLEDLALGVKRRQFAYV